MADEKIRGPAILIVAGDIPEAQERGNIRYAGSLVLCGVGFYLVTAKGRRINIGGFVHGVHSSSEDRTILDLNVQDELQLWEDREFWYHLQDESRRLIPREWLELLAFVLCPIESDELSIAMRYRTHSGRRPVREPLQQHDFIVAQPWNRWTTYSWFLTPPGPRDTDAVYRRKLSRRREQVFRWTEELAAAHGTRTGALVEHIRQGLARLLPYNSSAEQRDNPVTLNEARAEAIELILEREGTPLLPVRFALNWGRRTSDGELTIEV